MFKLIMIYLCLIIIAGLFMNDLSNKQKCLKSIYKTDDFNVKNGVLYCRSSDNSYQKLTKPKVRSSHIDEHFKGKNSE